MKTKVELIKNYPVESLKNWGDYFGYPEAICKKMISMTDCDWQNAKIAVLDDFGFQMINFLMNVKKVPLQNIHFLVSEGDEAKVELMKQWYSCFLENEVFSIYNINNMFDLIIANPPYGYASTLAIPITKMCMKQSHEVVCLAPLKAFRGPEVEPFVEFLENIGNLEDYFTDATLSNICITHITPGRIYERDFFRTYILTKKQQQIQQAIDDYNNSHSFSYKAQSNIIGPEFYEKLYLPNFEKIFLITWRGEGDGVHKKGGKDMMHNLEGKITECVGGSASGLMFKTKQERDNFAKWWYSCNEKRDNKDKIGLTNFLLDLICAFAGGGGRMKFYFENFPAIDWSHPWTDTEILKELGLPEDFLEKEA